jgi:hypothetical protein
MLYGDDFGKVVLSVGRELALGKVEIEKSWPLAERQRKSLGTIYKWVC